MRLLFKLYLGAAVLCLASAPVVAADAGTSGDAQHGSGDPVQVDLWQAGFTIAVFVALLAILSRTAFKPILAGLQKREDFIRDSLEQAKNDREAAEVRLKEYSDKLSEARAEASAIVDEGRRDAEVLKRKLEEDARAEAEATIERAKREIGIATETAVKEVYTLSAKLATGVASRVIRREVDAQQHERLISESIDELSKVYRN